ncbi:MAG: hypothetical protein ACOCUS_02840 [Polyangiales bacterium]
MDRHQALALFGSLPSRHIRELWEASAPQSASQLEPGLYLGRNGGMPRPAKWVARHLVQRDWFAKLVLEGFGVNVRCRQDGTHAMRPSRTVVGGVEVDLPFRLTDEGFDYCWHVAGVDLRFLQFRDVLRHIELIRMREVVPEDDLARVGVEPGEPCEEGDLVIGYMAPLGIEPLAGMPFGMIRDHDPTPAEVESANAYLRRKRLIDSSAGRALAA